MLDKLGDRARLLHIKDSVEKINEYVEGVDFESFEKSSLIKDACIRQLSIIGEACNRISSEVKASNVEIEWKLIIGLRNIVIHQYFGVDDRVIWDIIQESLPSLKSSVQIILKEL